MSAWDDLVALEANTDMPEAKWPVDLQLPTTEESPQEALPDWPETVQGQTSESADRLLPFELVKIDDTTIRVVGSTIDSQLPTGFSVGDDPVFTLTVSGDGYVYAKITYSTSTGVVSGREILEGASVPSAGDGEVMVTLGTYSTSGSVLTVAPNTAYGPITVTACRDWYNATPTYSLNAEAASAYFL